MALSIDAAVEPSETRMQAFQEARVSHLTWSPPAAEARRIVSKTTSVALPLEESLASTRSQTKGNKRGNRLSLLISAMGYGFLLRAATA
jgi:hypothetical protein